MVDRNCRHYAGDEETTYCMKKGFILDCTGCHGFVPQIRLRALIIQKCGTIREFSKQVGLSETMMSKILTGNRNIMAWHYETFANVLGVSVDELKGVIE